MSVFIIAEAGVNHNGDDSLAFELVNAAAESGADAIKFQTFKSENLVTKSAGKANYQKLSTEANESQLLMLKRLELNFETHKELVKYCKIKKIKFLSTAFDFESLNLLVSELSLDTLKISSGEITNGPLLLAHAKTGRKLILSTGMATMDEIEEALGVIAFGLLGNENLSRKAFQEAYLSNNGQRVLEERVTLLHCTTEYPAPFNDINLNAMVTMRDSFGLQTGYSDHSEGITVSIAAAALGATIIEKHFTLDRELPGPDHKASLEPNELKDMVHSIRIIEKILGDGIKCPMPSELNNRIVARKSIVAATNILKNEVFTKDNLTIKRPGTGKSPMDYWDLLGQQSQSDYSSDEVLN